MGLTCRKYLTIVVLTNTSGGELHTRLTPGAPEADCLKTESGLGKAAHIWRASVRADDVCRGSEGDCEAARRACECGYEKRQQVPALHVRARGVPRGCERVHALSACAGARVCGVRSSATRCRFPSVQPQ